MAAATHVYIICQEGLFCGLSLPVSAKVYGNLCLFPASQAYLATACHGRVFLTLVMSSGESGGLKCLFVSCSLRCEAYQVCAFKCNMFDV